MAFDFKKLIPEPNWTPRSIFLSTVYILVAVLAISTVREIMKERASRLSPEDIAKIEETMTAMTGMWLADPIQPEGLGSSLIGPTNRSLKLYPVDPKGEEPKYMLSGYFVTNTELSATGDAIVTALEILGAEGIDAAEVPSIEYAPRFRVVPYVAIGADDPWLGPPRAWVITIEKDDPTSITVSVVSGNTESKVKYRKYQP